MVDALVVAVVAGGTEAMARAAVVAADPASREGEEGLTAMAVDSGTVVAVDAGMAAAVDPGAVVAMVVAMALVARGRCKRCCNCGRPRRGHCKPDLQG